MRKIETRWTDEASRSYYALTDAQRRSADALIRTICDEPTLAQPSYKRRTPDGGEEQVYENYGLMIRFRYTFGWFKRILAMVIEDIGPHEQPELPMPNGWFRRRR